jgi:uncharacterized protein YlxW (UPF0749 family)
MSDPITTWEIVRDAISSFGVMIAVIISVVSLIKSSRQKQNDQLDKIQNSLTEHILDDEHSITELQTNVKNLTDNVRDLTNNVNNKLDTIIRELDK